MNEVDMIRQAETRDGGYVHGGEEEIVERRGWPPDLSAERNFGVR